nr:protein cab-1 isoform X1 [Nomia melanderi]XP_031828406.1 protein cab-1 isoform X1 [Nomia melanderi]
MLVWTVYIYIYKLDLQTRTLSFSSVRFCLLREHLEVRGFRYKRLNEVPEASKNAVLRQLIKDAEFRLSVFLANQAHWKQMVLDRQKTRELLEALMSNEPINEMPRERQRYLPLHLTKYYPPPERNNPYDSSAEYPSFELPYLPLKDNIEEPGLPENDYEYDQDELLKRRAYIDRVNLAKGMKKLLPVYQERYGEPPSSENDDDKMQESLEPEPDFTFKMDDSNLAERHPFAVKPNDPRYYQDGPFSTGDADRPNIEVPMRNETKPELGNEKIGEQHRMHEESARNADLQFKDTSMIVLPELERRTGYNPLVVPVNTNLNNDIYFIAIVAGCSAAAMFVLVLVTLTWCRLKRGAKAAADIEYPAYGVTGPNKEVSPSGDQRLAQSAQMYHFQHQKQQIIALENRVSASRDPGSVSEAESEEENEEGDYTVYECPGLASTGEMEVKNPLFHDDPTPATPAQMNKEEDHI